MEYVDSELLRKFVRRKIAEKNKLFGGMTKGFRAESVDIRKMINSYFANGSYWLKAIYEDIDKHGKDIAPYNYFDLDTLIAYDAYLGKVVENAEVNMYKNTRYYCVPNDFLYSLKVMTPKFFRETKPSQETGYYTASNPIRPLKDKSGNITYERTPTADWMSKQDSLKLQFMLDDYLKTIHPAKDDSEKNSDSKEVQENLEHSNEESNYEDFEKYYAEKFDRELIDYCKMSYKNDKNDKNNSLEDIYPKEKIVGYGEFNITRTQMFFDDDMMPIKYIEGVDSKGNYLKGYVNLDNQVYEGDVYNRAGDIVVDNSQSGIDIFKQNINDNEKER